MVNSLSYALFEPSAYRLAAFCTCLPFLLFFFSQKFSLFSFLPAMSTPSVGQTGVPAARGFVEPMIRQDDISLFPVCGELSVLRPNCRINVKKVQDLEKKLAYAHALSFIYGAIPCKIATVSRPMAFGPLVIHPPSGPNRFVWELEYPDGVSVPVDVLMRIDPLVQSDVYGRFFE